MTALDTSTLAPTVAVPFVDLAPSHRDLKTRILAGISEVIDAGAFLDGPQVAEFERAFAAHCGSPFCVGTANGTDALRLTLLAAGVGPGDEVIVPAMTFVATFEAVSQAGGVPVVVDVGDADYGLDVDEAAAAITGRTRVLLPVHLYGQMADMRRLSELAAEQGLLVVEDACQAHGARRDGLQAGTAGTAGVFSFYPSKNLGAFGDAGAIVTRDPVLADLVRALARHGQSVPDRHELEGYTARLDTIQAVVLLAKLPLLDRWNAERREATRFYSAALDGVGDLLLPPVAAGSEPVWHVYVVRTNYARRLFEFLRSRGIATRRHYPQCPHQTAAYSWIDTGGRRFPVAEALAANSLSLPLFAGITPTQLEIVAASIEEFFARV
jgi:dTDP-4-amino-4,6-dideoxygalactose transaminase